ncbi:MAG: RNA polymerase sigma factor SigZ [Planctomycetota bacterium]|jgi:RNA polymerase sigma-70 factor (ECF subfamily)
MEQHARTKEIWMQMHQRLLSYIRGRVATPHDAEDLLQDVFVRIHANLDDVRDTENVTAWVYQITRNVITDYYRQRAASTGALAELAEQIDEHLPPVPEREAQANVFRRASDEFAQCLEPMLDEVPEPYRQAVTLTEIEGMTQRDAAEKLGGSISGMKSRVQRGRGKLKDVILDCCEVELDRRGGLVDYRRRSPHACDGCGEER